MIAQLKKIDKRGLFTNLAAAAAGLIVPHVPPWFFAGTAIAIGYGGCEMTRFGDWRFVQLRKRCGQ